jgi:ABC-2 type transport system ATP-binding protein
VAGQDTAAKLLEQHPSVEQVAVETGRLAVTLRPDVQDYSDLPTLLVGAGCKLRLFREEEFNLENAFMALTKGLGSKI